MLVGSDAKAVRRPNRVGVAAIAFGVMLAVTRGSVDADDGPVLRRWAVAATPEVQATGLSDLLTARLSAVQGIKLVEREQLAAAIREQELSACFGSNAVPLRLKLGQVLQADVLVLLSMASPETAADSAVARGTGAELRSTSVRPGETEGVRGRERRLLRLVLSDCVYGARLHVDYLPFDPDAPDALAAECASAILQTRRKFAAGIERVIGVTHFLSQNLTHDYDHLQGGFAALLENSLRGFPGVAVIEIEEARAIAQELRLNGGGLKRPAVPVFVQGEFKMTGAGSDGPEVWLYVRLSEANSADRQIERGGLTVPQAVEWLTGELPRQILQLSSDQPAAAFARPQLKRLLISRADAFSLVGAYEDATALREAALLLDADDLAQRIRLIRDYDRWQLACNQENVAKAMAINRERLAGHQVDEDPRMWARTHAERMSRFRMTVPHVEYLIDRRLVNPREAAEIVSGTVESMKRAALYQEQEYSQKDQQALEEVFWRVLPSFPRLDYGLRGGTLHEVLRFSGGDDAWSADRQYQRWTQFAVDFIIGWGAHATDVGPSQLYQDHRHTLEYLYRFLTEIPQRELPISAMAGVSMRSVNHLVAAGCLSSEDARSFFERLRKTEPPLNKFYARCGLLALKAQGGGPVGPELLDEAAELLAFVDRIEASRPEARLATFIYRRELERLRTAVAQRSGQSPPERPPLPENPVPPTDPSPPIAFVPTGIPAPWAGWSRCGDRLNLMWSFDGVDLMPEKGNVRRIFELDAKQRSFSVDDMVYSAHWDGANVWTATMKSGVIVVSPAGEVVARIQQKQGLPAYEAQQRSIHNHGHLASLPATPPLRLQPIEPGKCLAVGRYGPHRRLWFAELSAGKDGQCRVQVFHQATKILDPPAEADLADPALVFPLGWTILYSDPARPSRRWWLLDRWVGVAQGGRPPLAVDLETLEVSVFPGRFPATFEGFWPQLQVGRSLLFTSGIQIAVFTPAAEGDPPGQWVAKTILDQPGLPPDQRQPMLFAHEGVIYNPGVHWRRIRPDDFAIETINDVPMAPEHRFEFYAPSARYGMVAWNRGDQLYQVSFHPAQETDLASRYPFVPADQRGRHDRAVRAIRRLGGSVATRWSVAEYPSQRPGEAGWRTLAYLPAEWTGGDAALAHLRDLYHLTDLYLVEAGVSDAGLREVGQLEDLESLCLVDTQVTDRGIAKLQTLPNLSYCRLEGTPEGGELSDAALEYLDRLPRLVAITLVGRGFTDSGLARLQTSRRLRELQLWGTDITPAGIAGLKKSRPWLTVSEKTPN
jgi:tetratricopeptide (TPR) repeat protein